MASITALLNTGGAVNFIEDVPTHMREELSVGVRDCLVLVERQHKKKEIRRASKSSSKAVADKWTTREGTTVRSFHRDWKKNAMEGAYGSDLRRVVKLEGGGTIKPKGKFLAIPTANAPKGVWPRHIPNLVFIKSSGGNPLLVRPTGAGSFLTMFILKRSVTLPPRPALARAVKATEGARDKRMGKALENALKGKGHA